MRSFLHSPNSVFEKFLDEITKTMGHPGHPHLNQHLDLSWQTADFYKKCIEFAGTHLVSSDKKDKHEAEHMVLWLTGQVAFVHPPEALREPHGKLLRVLETLIPPKLVYHFKQDQRCLLDSEIATYVFQENPVFNSEELLKKIEDSAVNGYFPRIIIDMASAKQIRISEQAGNPPDMVSILKSRRETVRAHSMDGFPDLFPVEERAVIKRRLLDAFLKKESLNGLLLDALDMTVSGSRFDFESVRFATIKEDLRLKNGDIIGVCSLTQGEAVAFLREQLPFKDFLGEYFTDGNPEFDVAYQKLTSSKLSQKYIAVGKKTIERDEDIKLYDLTKSFHVMGDYPFGDAAVVDQLGSLLAQLKPLNASEKSVFRQQSLQNIFFFLRSYRDKPEERAAVDKVIEMISPFIPLESKKQFDSLPRNRLDDEIFFHVRENSSEEKFSQAIEQISEISKLGRFPRALFYVESVNYISTLSKESIEKIRSAFVEPNNLNALLFSSLLIDRKKNHDASTNYMGMAKLSANDAIHVLAQTIGGAYIKRLSKVTSGSQEKAFSKLAESSFWALIESSVKKNYEKRQALSLR